MRLLNIRFMFWGPRGCNGNAKANVMEHIDKIIRVQDLAIVVIAIAISIIDIKTFRIPDMLLLLLFVLLLLFDFLKARGVFFGGPVAAPDGAAVHQYSFIFYNLLCAAIVFVLFFAIYYFVCSMGFGDVKYAAVLAYGLGFKGIYAAIVFAVVSGLLFFLIGNLFLGWNKKTKIAFAPFLSAGTIFTVVLRRVFGL